MQPLRGTKDILPNETIFWQHIYNKAFKILSLSNYHEIRTPILETTTLFKRSIGNGTDIVNKEMYSFIDQGERQITLRPEGTASIARAFISNKLYVDQQVKRMWYIGPMFRYERPQSGRQRQFHQLGIECIGSMSPMADAEVIRLAISILRSLQCPEYQIEINSIGNIVERNEYKEALINYLSKYYNDLDNNDKHKLSTNALKILDSKNQQTQKILDHAPVLTYYLGYKSKAHFNKVCEYLNDMQIEYHINHKLVRGLDYYNDTAFEIKTQLLGSQDTICGGGRYDTLIKQLGGPDTPSVGWAMGIERLLLLINKIISIDINKPIIYLATEGMQAQKNIWKIINILEEEEISFELDLNHKSFQKQLKKANKSGAQACFILGDNEVKDNSLTVKWMQTGLQETINLSSLPNLLQEIQAKKLDKVVL
uniref:histidine--tRNA ligase n=1 Tax=Riquetophycus sp. TaxID=1897556 RepID=A0A1C9C8B0_9FLOR|nr:histidine-tRNA synthetase [Riquetophycus sp.]